MLNSNATGIIEADTQLDSNEATQFCQTTEMAYDTVMGTSFVTTDGEHGFWMRDSTLEIWLRLLALHIREPNDYESAHTHEIAKHIRDQFLLASKGCFNGCVPHGLEEAVATKDGATLVRSAIESLLQSLEKTPRALNKDVLNLLAIDGDVFIEDFETWRLIEVAHAFLGLLDGKITSTAQSTAFMPGTRTQSELNQKLRGRPSD